MGQKITDIFEAVMKEGGLTARMRVSMIANIPSAKAAETPDTPENITKLKNAYKEVLGKDYKG